MDIKQFDSTDKKTNLLIKNTDIVFLNSIRRAAMSDVNVLGIQEVTFYENDSVLFDEFLAHRIGLLPIKSDLKSYKKGDKIKFVLEKEGPCTVYAKDLQCTDPKIEIVDKKIPLTKLKEGQKLKLEATAIMDSGRQHSKFQPGIIGYQYAPELSTDNGVKESTILKEIKKEYSDFIVESNEKKIILKNVPEAILSEKLIEKLNAKRQTYRSKDSFLVSIETHGNISISEMLIQAAKSLKDKTSEFKKAIKNL